MIIVYCLDERYKGLAEVSIKTVRKHNPLAKIVVVSENPMNVKGSDDNYIFYLDGQHRTRGAGDRISRAAYLKLLLPNLPYDKIIFLDGDVICQHPLDELWNTDVPYIGLCESHVYGKKQAKELGVPKYGLSGMMLMNLKALRDMDFTNKCLKEERQIPALATGWQHDETIINWVMKGKLTFLDKKFNYCHDRAYDNPIPEKDAVILHIVGKDKSFMANFVEKVKYKELKKIGAYIKDSRVAIVGNGKTIFDKKWGKEIDDHDFIIRFNKGFYANTDCQGTRTDMLILACNLAKDELDSFKARFVVNRSKHYYNLTPYTINTQDRMALKEMLGSQPSTGFMAIDICRYFGAKSIDLYGFSGNKAPTFYNPVDYVTQHDYDKEQEYIWDFEKQGILKNNS